jgi:hypothetical protein
VRPLVGTFTGITEQSFMVAQGLPIHIPGDTFMTYASAFSYGLPVQASAP